MREGGCTIGDFTDCSGPRSHRLCVVKLGGSLLDLPDLPARLDKVLSADDQPTALVVGGGAAVKQLHARYMSCALTNEQAHWDAIAQMSINAARLARLIELPLAPRLADCSRLTSERVIIDPMADLKADAGATLPIGWHVTSDSIAAWCAERLNASRLTLLKSVGARGPLDVREAIAAGWIDEHFLTTSRDLASRGCVVDWIDLRHDPSSRIDLLFHEKPSGSR